MQQRESMSGVEGMTPYVQCKASALQRQLPLTQHRLTVWCNCRTSKETFSSDVLAPPPICPSTSVSSHWALWWIVVCEKRNATFTSPQVFRTRAALTRECRQAAVRCLAFLFHDATADSCGTAIRLVFRVRQHMCCVRDRRSGHSCLWCNAASERRHNGCCNCSTLNEAYVSMLAPPPMNPLTSVTLCTVVDINLWEKSGLRHLPLLGKLEPVQPLPKFHKYHCLPLPIYRNG